jgi:hypothetical protein
MTDTPMPPAMQALPPGQSSLPELTGEIMKAHADVMGALGYGAAAAIRAGHALKAAKDLLKKQRGHGLWQDYVAVECRLGLRTAQIYMYLAKHEDQLRQLLAVKTNGNTFLSQGQALRLLSVARKKRRRAANVRAAT